jgi:hypothetical protein
MNVWVVTEYGRAWRFVRNKKEIFDEFPNAKEFFIEDGPDDSNKSTVRVQNACGIIYVEDRVPTHQGWKRGVSIFGMVKKAYTMAGNFVHQGDKISFKGAVHPQSLKNITGELVRGDFNIRMQLIVLSVGIHKCVDVTPQGLIEVCLGFVKWIRVMRRCQEICNVVVFYIRDWRLMEQDLKIPAWNITPKSCTVSVTKRGTMTVRLTWEGIVWDSNDQFKDITLVLARFVRDII